MASFICRPLTEYSVESRTAEAGNGIDRKLEGAARRAQEGQDDPRDRRAVAGVADGPVRRQQPTHRRRVEFRDQEYRSQAEGEAPGEIRRPYQVVLAQVDRFAARLGRAGRRGRGKGRGDAGRGAPAAQSRQGDRR